MTVTVLRQGKAEDNAGIRLKNYYKNVSKDMLPILHR
jgi:hypothetical protein